MREVIATPGAPPAVGAYSQAIKHDALIFCSGQIGLDPTTGELVAGGLGPQTERALRNLGAVLEAAGAGLGDVVKTTCFLADIEGYAVFNEVYARFFPGPAPARATFAVAGLPRGAEVEIEAIAVRA
jgi:2-iminobutanoate/2-iminopropanoate deaminase